MPVTNDAPTVAWDFGISTGSWSVKLHFLDGKLVDMERVDPPEARSGPSAQHRAECDCAEFTGGRCEWPRCDPARKVVDPPEPAPPGTGNSSGG